MLGPNESRAGKLISSAVLLSRTHRLPDKIADEGQAKAFLVEYNSTAEGVWNAYTEASWTYNTNITDHNKQLMVGEAALPAPAFWHSWWEMGGIFGFKDLRGGKRFSLSLLEWNRLQTRGPPLPFLSPQGRTLCSILNMGLFMACVECCTLESPGL